MPNYEPTVLNALLRCTRTSRENIPLFECVREDLNLWVWELGPSTDSALSAWILSVSRAFRENMNSLASLSDTDDYTLHLSFSSYPESGMLRLPPDFLGLAHQAGFAIEIHHQEL
jgi:hypothetical protein